jgi:cell division protein FtsL
MSTLTVDGFAPERLRPLRGKGGNYGRRDNGVPPSPPRALPSVRPRVAALEWRDARLPIVGRLWARGWLPSMLIAALLVLLMYLVQTSGVATTGYDIQRLQTERDDWQLRNEQLQLELAKRQSLTWIESEATGRLGMVRAEPTALTYVKLAR